MKLPANLLLMLAGTLVLTSCSMLVGKSEDLTVYAPTLAAPTLAGPAQSPPHKARAWQLSVAEPHAISPLDGAHIAVMPVAGEVQTYKGVRWRDSAPVLVQQLLFQAFQDTAVLPGLGAPASVLHADFALQSNLRDFQAEYRGAKVPTVVIRLSTQPVENSTGRVLAART